MHCSTKSLTRLFVQLAVRKSLLLSPLAKLARVMVHGSFLLATAPQRFVSRWVRFPVKQCTLLTCQGNARTLSVEEQAMRTQSIDTHPETERVMVELIRRAPMSKRFRLVQALTQSALWSNIQVWRESHRESSEQEAAVHIVSCRYGAAMAQRVQAALETRATGMCGPSTSWRPCFPRCVPSTVCTCRTTSRLDCQLTARDAAAGTRYRPGH